MIQRENTRNGKLVLQKLIKPHLHHQPFVAAPKGMLSEITAPSEFELVSSNSLLFASSDQDFYISGLALDEECPTLEDDSSHSESSKRVRFRNEDNIVADSPMMVPKRRISPPSSQT